MVRAPCPLPEAATPSAVETTPSIPLAPRLASTAAAHRAGLRRTTRDPGSAWTPRPRAWRPSRAAWRWTTRATSGSLRSVAEDLGDGRLRLRLPSPPRIEPLRIGRCRASQWRRRASGRTRSGGTRSPPVSGSAHCRQGSTTMTRAPASAASATNVAQRSGEPGRPEQDDALGERRARVRTMASAAAMVPVHPAPRQRVGQHGPAQPVGQPCHAGGVRPLRPGSSGDDQSPAPEGLESVGGGTGASARRSTTVGPWRAGSGAAVAGEGLAELQVEMDRPGTAGPVHRLLEGPDGQRPPRVLLALGRHARRRRPSGSPRRRARSGRWSAGPRCGGARAAGPPCRR